MITRLFFLLMLPIYLSASSPTSIDFYKGNLTKAKERAAQEGKLYFVQFTATWCDPCRWMDEVTYKDPALVAYIKQHYIPVKVDIDDFDGFAYKQTYNIRFLPSVLVFSSEGDLLQKHEDALPPSGMLAMLKKHNIPENHTAPQAYARNEAQPTPAPKMTHSPVKENISRPALKPAKRKPAPVKEIPAIESEESDDEDEMEEFNETYNFIITEHVTSMGFSVQIGVYSSYKSVLQKVKKVREKFEKRMIVHVSEKNGKEVYKIMIGAFPSHEMADDFRGEVIDQGFRGVVKDLSLLK